MQVQRRGPCFPFTALDPKSSLITASGCESWTIKKAESRRIDAFELWCWWRLLRVPWTAGRSKLKEISPEYSLEGLMLKLKSQLIKELTHLKRLWCWERLKRGGEGDDNGWDGWMASPTQWRWVWVSSERWWGILHAGMPGMLQSMGLQRVGHDWATELNWGITYVFIYTRAMGRIIFPMPFTLASWDLNSLLFLNIYLFRLCWVLVALCRIFVVFAALGLSCFLGCGISVPWPLIKPTSPAPQEGFLTTGPPRKFPESPPLLNSDHPCI